MRTAKSCGPDAPTLASSLRSGAQVTVAKEPGHRESTKETVKTIARGMPGVSGVTVVTNARAFYTTRAAADASSVRHSLRPLIEEGGTNGKTSRGTCGEIAFACHRPA
jgi:hypothetical protein